MALAPRAGVLARKLNQSVAVLSKLVDDLRLKHGDAGSSEDVVWSCRNELDRLHFWDRDHQVLNGYLDHALRESSHLKDQVVELLDELCEIKAVASVSSEISSIHSEESRISDTLALPLRPTSSGEGREEQILKGDSPETTPFEKQAIRAASSLTIDTTHSFDDSEPSNSTDKLIGRVREIITLLFQLGRALRDPAPHDRLEKAENDNGAQADLLHIETKFPNADESLIKRLGKANWERRQSLIKLRTRNMGSIEDNSVLVGSKPSNKLAVLSEGAPDSSTDVSSMVQTPNLSRTVSTAPSMIFSQPESKAALSASDGRITMHTELSDEKDALEEIPSEGSRSRPSRLVIPAPPAPNQGYEGEVFLCPYCHIALESIRSRKAWIQHVFRDLEPYMCTSLRCLRSDKTFADRSSWWSHETSVHRSLRTWTCGPCLSECGGGMPDTNEDSTTPLAEGDVADQLRLSTSVGLDSPGRGNKQTPQTTRNYRFANVESFKEHLRQHHPDVSEDSRAQRITDLCEENHGVSRTSRICPLCQIELADAQEPDAGEYEVLTREQERKVRAHIADHLEQLTLFVALPGDMGVGVQDDPIFFDDSDSEAYEKDEIQSIMSDDRHLSRSELRRRNVNVYLFEAPSSGNLRQNPAGKRIETSAHASNQHLDPRRPVEPSQSFENLRVSFPLNTVHHPRNEFFHGNEDLMEDMQQVLGRPGGIYVIHGPAGVGKTISAVEFSYRASEDYDGVFWLQADTTPGLAESYIQMTDVLQISMTLDDQKRAIDRGLEWLTNTSRRWLLIFDNVENFDSIRNYIPHELESTNGSIVLTTQSADLRTIRYVQGHRRLTHLNESDGAHMLLNYLKKNAQDDHERHLAEEVSSFVGGLPVAIAHVAGYAAYSDCTLEDLLETFRQWRRRAGVATDEADDLPASFRRAAFSYDETLAMVWNVTLRDLNRDAQDLIYILAYLNPEAVPESMIWSYHDDTYLDEFLNKDETLRAKKTKKSLTERRLVDSKLIHGEKCFAVHRALQRSIQDTLAQDEAKQQHIFNLAVSMVREVFPTSSPIQQPRPEAWVQYQRFLPHLHALRDAYLKRKPQMKGSIEFAQLLSDAGINQWERGVTREGLLLLRTAEEVLDSIAFDGNDVMRADIHTIIGLMYDNTGLSDRREARIRRQKALQIRQMQISKQAEPRHDDEVLLYNAWMDLAISHLQFHDFRKAEPIVNDCLQQYRKWGEPEEIPYEYAKYYNKIAIIRMYQQRFEEAVEMARLGVEWMDRTENFSLASRFKFDLACIYLQAGQREEALRLHRDIFDARLDKLGPSSELTLHSRYAIGAIYELKQQYEEAEIWFSKAYSSRRAAQWPEEAVARTQFHLARVLQAQGRTSRDKVDEMRTEALGVLNRLLKTDQPSILKPTDDEVVLFDHIMTICGARFTGEGLLKYVP